MGVLTGIDEAKNQISVSETAFAGRATSVKLTMSTSSMPPTNYYEIIFEDSIKTIKGTAPTSYQFNYQQTGKGLMLMTTDGVTQDMPAPKKPESGQSYVAIYNSNENTIEKLIEITENDLSSF